MINRFMVNNGEVGPTVQYAPKSILINTNAGIRNPKLVNLVKYFYKNCALATAVITEEISIEVQGVNNTWNASTIIVTNGEINGTHFNTS
jgi:hypothetical protein